MAKDYNVFYTNRCGSTEIDKWAKVFGLRLSAIVPLTEWLNFEIELCSKLKLHTIVPTILTKNYPYKDIKKKLTNASIISLPINSSTEIELPTIIDYLNQRGFSLLTLDELLSENFEK